MPDLTTVNEYSYSSEVLAEISRTRSPVLFQGLLDLHRLPGSISAKIHCDIFFLGQSRHL